MDRSSGGLRTFLEGPRLFGRPPSCASRLSSSAGSVEVSGPGVEDKADGLLVVTMMVVDAPPVVDS